MSEEPRKAFTARLVFEGVTPILVLGKGNHDCERWELSRAQIAGIVKDAVPELLSPSLAKPPVAP